jgi:hypothetical protein
MHQVHFRLSNHRWPRWASDVVTGVVIRRRHAAVQDADLLTERPPDDEQRFDQHGQVGEVLDKLFDPPLDFTRPNHPDLEAEVTQGATQVVVDGMSWVIWCAQSDIEAKGGFLYTGGGPLGLT